MRSDWMVTWLEKEMVTVLSLLEEFVWMSHSTVEAAAERTVVGQVNRMHEAKMMWKYRHMKEFFEEHEEDEQDGGDVAIVVVIIVAVAALWFYGWEMGWG
mmetsp:Transcript_8063/g.16447  ORF Transcript_8063/g.16447 Transcript_8063/m.16447 type:complete len:100 (+) Transcript_8063:181-480(+)